MGRLGTCLHLATLDDVGRLFRNGIHRRLDMRC